MRTNLDPGRAALRTGRPDAAGAAQKPAARTATQVPLQKTPTSVADLKGALERAHRKLFGHAPSAQALDVLGAQVSVETGSGTSMYNYNFGGIKGAGPTGKTAVARTKEVIDGKTIEIRDGFRAYDSLDEGAADYLALLRDRFGPALDAARRGDFDGFASKLKKAGYYTADEGDYARALRSIAGAPAAGPAPRARASAYVTTDELARISDAMSAQDFSSMLSPSALTPKHHPKAEDEDD